ncbi:MAG TPA: TM0106 family RecB-like putative nuclease [Lacunisphaera sp.]
MLALFPSRHSTSPHRPRLGGPRSDAYEYVTAPTIEKLRTAKWALASTVRVRTSDLETCIQAVVRVPSVGRGSAAQFIPVRFACFNKLSRNDKLLFAFDALSLSGVLGRDISVGNIIHGDDHAIVKVKTSALAGELRKHLEQVAALLSSASPPDLVLNRHCAECEFQARCRKIAIEKDDLSLLSGMSVKERQKLRSKGIFTVTQLSYMFRPRRRPRRQRDKREKYQHALKALAIREKKIHIVGSPELKIEGTPVYLDVEGLPDRDFYYLIGIRIGNGEKAVQHSLWADTFDGERTIWNRFIEILATLEHPVLFHYGSYETTFLKRMKERYGISLARPADEKTLESAINLLSVTYSRIYFPCCSNGLKGVAGWLGFRWADIGASGIGSVCLRNQWERSRTSEMKQRLVHYNTEDCIALELVLTSVINLIQESATRPDVAFADRYGSKPISTALGIELHKSLQDALRSAHASYRHHRISFSGMSDDCEIDSAEVPPAVRRPRRSMPASGGRIIYVPRKRICLNHPDNPTRLHPTKREVRRTLLDVAFTKSGCKKVFVTYIGRKAHCPFCDARCLPPVIQRMGGRRLFGDGICAWVIYLRVALRLSYRLIANAARALLHEEISIQTIMGLIEQTSLNYISTEKSLLCEILRSPVIHIDETKLNIRGIQQYVWVMTDGQRVVFRLTVGRETDFLHRLLKGYSGTIVSDFYGGYDALPCRQQKCLAHLIRDLNEDLWGAPFDEQYEQFVVIVRDLLFPIFKDIQRFGLKTFHLNKHRARVARFYRDVIDCPPSCNALIAKYQKRFIRYRDSILTFLEYDGIPWNNNAAERAIRHLAVQRKISNAFSEKGANDYLRFLAISQTCRFQGKSFLDFLISGKRNVGAYKETHRRKSVRPAT